MLSWWLAVIVGVFWHVCVVAYFEHLFCSFIAIITQTSNSAVEAFG